MSGFNFSKSKLLKKRARDYKSTRALRNNEFVTNTKDAYKLHFSILNKLKKQ